MLWRLGIDLGSNSLGWWAFRLARENGKYRVVQSLDGGVIIYPDGREPQKAGRVGDSNAVQRRIARGMRRNRDHGKNRIKLLVRDLIRLGLLPEDKAARDRLFQTPPAKTGDPERFNPYRLRAEALERALAPDELGRVLFHLGLRRGFKSNRKEASEDDGGDLKERMAALNDQLRGRTLGRFLWDTYQAAGTDERAGADRPGIRFRGDSDLYPSRAMIAAEFDAVRAAQAPHHDLTGADWDKIRDERVLFQWPLKPVERGWCEFFPDQPRHWKDTPLGHDFRVFQELNALRWVGEDLEKHPLDRAQRAAVLEALMTRKSEVKFDAMRKFKGPDKQPLFPAGIEFNLEAEKRRGLKPHRFAAAFMADADLAPLWHARRNGDEETLDDIFEVLHRADDDAEVRARLTGDFGLTPAQADKLAAFKLGGGTAHVSRKFMARIVPVLDEPPYPVYAKAVGQLLDDDGKALHHSVRDDGERWPRLPYYGQVMPASMLGAKPDADPETEPEKHFGRINNPTVHVALNQLRKLVNALTDRFGAAPRQVHLELTRELKMSRQKRDDLTKRQAAQEKENKRISDFCAALGIDHPSVRDIKKVKLWEELGEDQLSRSCVFTGQPISAQQLFNGEAEIEHILPFKRTLDDTMANLTVSLRRANRVKGNNAPYQAFGQNQQAANGIVWAEVNARAQALPKNKRWRFAETAMEEFEANNDFLARQLTDTAYMSRVAQRYLRALKGVEQVIPNRGSLTGLVRGKWGLNGILADDNKKSREDHRHHAVDAAVIALTDRAVLQEISRQSARAADDRMYLAVPDLDPDIRDAIRERVPEIIVRHKPDHGRAGKMFKETAYGFIREDRRDPDKPDRTAVTRKALASLTEKECADIRDPLIRAAVADHLAVAKDAGVKHDKALADFSVKTGIKRIRVLVANQTVRPVPSAPYKGYAPDSYVCCDIWRLPAGKKGKWKAGEYKWEGRFWSYAETIDWDPDDPASAAHKDEKKPHPAAKFVMRLYKDDLIVSRHTGKAEVFRVNGFSTTNNRIDLQPHARALPGQTYVGINVIGKAGIEKYVATPDGRRRRWRPSSRPPDETNRPSSRPPDETNRPSSRPHREDPRPGKGGGTP